MKIRFSPHSQPQPRKNDPVISFITNDLRSAYTLPTPKNSLLDQNCQAGGREEVTAP
jgi:hypothetical protein